MVKKTAEGQQVAGGKIKNIWAIIRFFFFNHIEVAPDYKSHPYAKYKEWYEEQGPYWMSCFKIWVRCD